MNTALASNNTVDGGEGNDTLEASVDVSVGSFVSIETLELLGAAAAADLSKFDNDLDRVDIKTTNTMTLTAAPNDVVLETVSGGDVVFASATGSSVQMHASGDLTVTNTADTGLEDLKIDFVGGGASTLTVDGGADNDFKTITIEGTNGNLTIAGSAVTSTTGALTEIDASAADHAILMGSGGATPSDAVLGTVTSLTTGDGADALYMDLNGQDTTFTLGAGDDTLEVFASAGTSEIRIYGGAGGDDITLGAGVEAKIYYTSMADFESGDAENITGFVSGTDDLVIQISGVNNTVSTVTTEQSAGVASGVYWDSDSHIVYVSDGTNLGVINDISENLLASDIEVF